ncbi:hypothetical protein [Rhizobium sp. CAU 1783]
MFSAAHDPFLFRIGVFVLALAAGWFLASRTSRSARQPLVLIGGLVAAVIASGAVYAVARFPAGEARSSAFIALLLASTGLFAALGIARGLFRPESRDRH